MAEFDPDAYLKKKAAPPRATGFNPDAYLAQRKAKPTSPSLLEEGGLMDRATRAGADVSTALLPDWVAPGLVAGGRAVRGLLRGEGGEALVAAGAELERERAKEGPTVGASMARGGAQGATLGFRDELAGNLAGWGEAARIGADELGDVVTGNYRLPRSIAEAARQAEEKLGRIGSTYTRERDASRALDAEAREANPKAFLAGEVLGGAVIPAGAVARGATSGARVLRGALAGAGTGTVGGAGASTGETVAEVRNDALVGGGLGGLLGAAGPGLAAGARAGLNALPETLSRYAAEKAMKAAGYIGKDFKAITKRYGAQADDVIAERGRELLSSGVIRAGQTAEDVVERLPAALDEANRVRAGLLSQADAAGAQWDARPFLREVMAEQVTPNVRDPIMAPFIRRQAVPLLREYHEQAQRGLSLSQAERMKRNLQGKVNFGNSWNDNAPVVDSQELRDSMQSALRQSVEDQLGAALGPESRATFIASKRRLGALLDAEQRAAEEAARLKGNSPLGTRDAQAAQLAAQVGGGPGAAALAGMLVKGLRERGNSALAVGADRLGDAAATPAGATARRLLANALSAGDLAPSGGRAYLEQGEATSPEAQRARALAEALRRLREGTTAAPP